MKAGILLGRRTPEAMETAAAAQAALEAAGESCIIGEHPPSHTSRRALEGLDVLMAIGGDGTILSATRRAAQLGIPVLGINLGRVGFLSELEPENVVEGIGKLLAGEYHIERRLMLRVSYQKRSWYGLNEISIGSRRRGRIIRASIHIGGKLYGEFACDGLLASTPTGSTAYSLSTGGPILAPGLRTMVVAAICPHTLRHRHMVVDAKETVQFNTLPECGNTILFVDGQEEATLLPGAGVTITQAPFDARMIRFGQGDFYALVRSKLAE